MRQYGCNPDRWRDVLRYALTPAGGVILCIISALVVALALGYILAWAGWIR